MPRIDLERFSWPETLSDNNMELFTLEQIHSYLSPPTGNASSAAAADAYNGSGYDADAFGAYQRTAYVLDRYVTTILCGFGCLGNALNMVVLMRMRWMKTDGGCGSGGGGKNSAQTGLISLSVSDLLFCLALMPRGFVRARAAVFPAGFWLYYQAYGTWIVTTLILTSTWITVVVSTLRYVAICHPLLSRRVDGPLCSRICYLAVFLICVGLNLPSLWQYRISEYERGLYLIDIGLLDLATAGGKAFMWLRAAVGIFVPAGLLLFCNVSLIAALRRSQRMRRGCYVRKDASLGMRNRVTVMLIVIATAFIALVFPAEVMDFFHDLLRRRRPRHVEAVMLIRSITNVLQVINFTFNFVIYCILNIHFRDVLRRSVCFCSAPIPDNAPSDLDRHWHRLARFNMNGSTKTFVSAV